MNRKLANALFVIVVAGLIVVVAYLHHNITEMQKQLDAMNAQHASETVVVTTPATTGFEENTDVIPDADAAADVPSTTAAPAQATKVALADTAGETPDQVPKQAPAYDYAATLPAADTAQVQTQPPAVPPTPPADQRNTQSQQQSADNTDQQNALQNPGDRFNYRRYDPMNDPYYDSWDPYREIERMQAEMDRMMNDAFGPYAVDPYYGPQGFGPGWDNAPNTGPNAGPGYGPYGPQHRPGRGNSPANRPDNSFSYSYHDSMSMPQMHLEDKGDKYVVYVDLPGTDADSISVKLEDDVLSISGRQSYENEQSDKRGNMTFREHRSSSFHRSMELPGPVQKRGMKTAYENGVLRITIPKA